MKTRFISALLLLPLVLGALVAGGWPFTIFIVLVVGLAGREFVQLLQRKGYVVSLAVVLGVALVWLAEAHWGGRLELGVGLAAAIYLSAARQLFAPRRPEAIVAWALAVAGGMYLGVGGAYILKLRASPDGLWWLLLAFPVVWVADSGAYFIGRRWGKHKIAPHISPGKSWEGYIAEIVSGLLAGAGLGALWPFVAGRELSVTPLRGLLLGGLLAILTPLGDFFVSLIKREAGVKDSSNLIPGHGGVFDRIDSLLWAAVLTWLFVLFSC